MKPCSRFISEKPRSNCAASYWLQRIRRLADRLEILAWELFIDASLSDLKRTKMRAIVSGPPMERLASKNPPIEGQSKNWVLFRI